MDASSQQRRHRYVVRGCAGPYWRCCDDADWPSGPETRCGCAWIGCAAWCHWSLPCHQRHGAAPHQPVPCWLRQSDHQERPETKLSSSWINLSERIDTYFSTKHPEAAQANRRTASLPVTLDDEFFLIIRKQRAYSPVARALASSALPIPPLAFDHCTGSSRNFRTSLSAPSLK